MQALAKEWLGAVELGFRMRRGLDAAEKANTPQAINGCGAGLDVNAYGGQAPFL